MLDLDWICLQMQFKPSGFGVGTFLCAGEADTGIPVSERQFFELRGYDHHVATTSRYQNINTTFTTPQTVV